MIYISNQSSPSTYPPVCRIARFRLIDAGSGLMLARCMRSWQALQGPFLFLLKVLTAVCLANYLEILEMSHLSQHSFHFLPEGELPQVGQHGLNWRESSKSLNRSHNKSLCGTQFRRLETVLLSHATKCKKGTAFLSKPSLYLICICTDIGKRIEWEPYNPLCPERTGKYYSICLQRLPPPLLVESLIWGRRAL